MIPCSQDNPAKYVEDRLEFAQAAYKLRKFAEAVFFMGNIEGRYRVYGMLLSHLSL